MEHRQRAGGRLALWLCLLSLAPAAVAGCDRADRQRAAACRDVAERFGARLRAELQRAMQEGGPAAAVDICHEVAPTIAAELAAETGWRVGRTSLRWRNPDHAPDAWEEEGMRAMAAELAAGAVPGDLERHELVTAVDGRRYFRYLKAIPTGPVCLRCHGARIDSTVAARLGALYPDDQAVGFQAGELRGAFTITQPLPR